MEEYTLYESQREFIRYLDESKSCDVTAKIKLEPIEEQPQHYIDIEFSNRGTETLIVAMAGAYKMNVEKTLPFYIAKGFKNKLNASIAYVGDPSLYLDDVRLGWYAGDRNNAIQKGLVDILRKLFDFSNAKRIIFFGGSGGGFASLYYSQFFSESLSLIWNPQIFIERYDAAKFAVVNEYSRAAFNCSREELNRYICSDLSKHLKRSTPERSLILYMQNITDKHVQRDLVPLCEHICSKEVFSGLNFEKQEPQMIDDDFLLYMNNWSLGHKPPPRGVLLYLLSSLSKDDSVWTTENFEELLQSSDEIAAKS